VRDEDLLSKPAVGSLISLARLNRVEDIGEVVGGLVSTASIPFERVLVTEFNGRPEEDIVINNRNLPG
jgi:hypothetical protein